MAEWVQDCLSLEGREESGVDLSTVIFDSYDDQRLMGTLGRHSRRERVV
jgi:hypothetical protein